MITAPTAPTAAKKRILFVDDEPSILAGLQNLLYKDRRRWDMVFAPSGEVALEKLRAQRFDVVVSDMRMPGMDGATLLNRVREASPSTARIMLSGHAEREAIVRALPALHQLLAKPCDAPTLRATIERALACEDATTSERVRAVIGRLDKLPTPKPVCDQMMHALRAGALDELHAVVSSDPGLAAKVLQLVNSAYFGSGQKTSSIKEAVALLGAEQLRYIADTASVFGAAEDPFPEFSLRRTREHAVKTAHLVRSFAKGALAEEAFSGALLHNIGRVVLAFGFPAEYRALMAQQTATGESMTKLEQRAFGVGHDEVGALLLQLWGLPMPLVDIVRFSHRPGDAPEATRAIAAAVHVAEALTDRRERSIELASLERAGCASVLPVWREIAEGMS